MFHDYLDNGAAVAFAYASGWLYIWPYVLAVGIAYLLVRMLAKIVARAKPVKPSRENPSNRPVRFAYVC